MKTAPSRPARLLPWSLALALLAAGLAPASAAPLTAVAAVQTQPDPSAPVITYLKPGTEPTPAAEPLPPLPPGWIAVDLPGPFVGYVRNSNFTKDLAVRPGSAIRLEPKEGAGALTTAAKDDKIEIIGLYGNWTQVRLSRSLVGYVEVGPPTPAAPETAASEPASEPALPPLPTPSAAPGAPAPASAASAGNAPLPRYLEGKFTSSRRLFELHPPYPWELVDDSGARIAYLDLHRLLLTAPMSEYEGRDVIVYGPVHTLPGGSKLVIEVQSLQLK
jgi:hypothetical protein